MNSKLPMACKHFFNIHRLSGILISMLLPVLIPAQTKSIITGWVITARSAGNNAGYDIRVEQYKNEINFTFKRLDSLRQQAMEKDPAYIAQRAAVKISGTVDEITFQIEKLATIIAGYEVAVTDQFSKPIPLNDTGLQMLLDSLATIPAEILSSSSVNTSTSGIANGFSYHFVRYRGKKKTADFYTTSPDDRQTQPAFRLITQILSYYRRENKAAIITAPF